MNATSLVGACPVWKAEHIILFLPQPSLIDWAFCIGEEMKHYKKWGTVSSGAELYMLSHAERTRKRKQKKKLTGQRLPAFKVHKNK